eukprot:INCI16017.1.p1 GENE.INCI16017.1~~INCI16017.1.p1  ORF type:complete len:215 (+),score=26.00 INCI16017.1:268-912(+)
MVWCGLVGVRATAVVLEAFALVVPYGLGTIAVGLGWMWRAGSDALRGASATSVVAGASGCLTIFLKIRRLAFNYQKVTWTVSCQRICWMTSGPLAPEQWTDAAKYLTVPTHGSPKISADGEIEHDGFPTHKDETIFVALEESHVELYASEFSAQVPDGVPKAAKITSSITAPVPEQARVTSPPPSCFWISIYEVTTVHGKWKVVKPTVFAVCNN